MPKIDPTDIVSLLDTGYESEGEINTRKMVADINRKKNKSGCFQSMGITLLNFIAFSFHLFDCK